MEIKIELLKLGKRQKDLIAELRGRGFKVSPSDFSCMVNGYLQTPKAEKVLAESEVIINEWKESAEA